MSSKLSRALSFAGPVLGLAAGLAVVHDVSAGSVLPHVLSGKLAEPRQAPKPALQAQQGQAGPSKLSKQLEKAKLLRRMGQDPARAAKLLRGIAQDPGASPQLRSSALYQLALCLRAMKQEKAAKAALQQAAAGQGADADKAKLLLQGNGAIEKDKLKKIVHQAIEGYLHGDKAGASQRNLKWLGRAALPQLIAATQSYRYDQDKMRRIVPMILEIGGTEAESFLSSAAKSKDLLFRRAVVQGLSFMWVDPSRWVDPKLATVMRQFLGDSDAEIRAQALRTLRPTFSDEELLTRMQSARTYKEFCEALRGISNRTRSDVRALPKARELARKASESILKRWPTASEAERELLGTYSANAHNFLACAFYSVPGRQLILHLVKHPRALSSARPLKFTGEVEKGLPIEEILSAAKELGPCSTVRPQDNLRQEFLLALAFAERDRPKLELLPLLLELTKLKYDYLIWRTAEQTDLLEWLLDVAAPDHLPRVAELLLSFRNPAKTLIRLSTNRIVLRTGFEAYMPTLLKITQELCKPKRLDKREAELDPGVSRTSIHIRIQRELKLLKQLHLQLMRSRSPKVLAALLGMAKQGRISWDDLALQLLSRHDAEAKNTLAKIALEPELKSKFRGRVLNALIAADPQRYAGLVPKSFALGISVTETRGAERRKFFGKKSGPLLHLWAQDPQNPRLWTSAITEEQLVRVFKELDGILGGDSPEESWDCLGSDLITLLKPKRSNRQVRIPRGMLDAVARMLPKLSLAQMLPKLSGNGFRVDIGINLAGALTQHAELISESYTASLRTMIESPSIALKRSGLAHMWRKGKIAEQFLPQILACFTHEDPGIWNSAYSAAALTGTDAAFAALRKELSKPEPRRRQAAMSELTQHFRDRAAEIVVPLLQDKDHSVRLSAICYAGTLFSKRAVPDLIRLMSDPSDEIRKAAKESLDKIRYYHEQVAHWKKWLDGTGTGASTPAEALIHQVQKGKTKEIRLLAIRSLGTLADPKTLPFLISLMENKDPELASTARKAIETAHRLIEAK